GGMYMNAGAYGGELVQVAVSARFLSLTGEVREYHGEEMGLSYRHSAFMEQAGLIVSARFRLRPGDPEAVTARMRELMEKRSKSQPLDLPSAGSTFKRPVGGYAAALIQDAGLKGFRVGDAAVSEKHSGFVVNLGHATAADVLELIRQVQERVCANSGIRLEPEVRLWGTEEAT
ncbi:MAG: UDP-N-acetylenolpyruvoylglucosamine reductase, partial [Oscillospiraceae bacterium]|nr:UDP-N-acetylenolpyruvoylglucosamine reductase [Oscillospiraceae bacterium]